MALFPEMTIKSKEGNLKLIPLHVDQQKCSVPKSGLNSMGVAPRLGVEYVKTYVYCDISSVDNFPKSTSKALFDLFFKAQDNENILDVDIVYFNSQKKDKRDICRIKFKGWITQYAIINPVTDLRQYVVPNWEPSFENLQSSFPSISGASNMALLRLELTGATDSDNRKLHQLT